MWVIGLWTRQLYALKVINERCSCVFGSFYIPFLREWTALSEKLHVIVRCFSRRVYNSRTHKTIYVYIFTKL